MKITEAQRRILRFVAGSPGQASWHISATLGCRGGSEKSLKVLERAGLVTCAGLRWYPTQGAKCHISTEAH